MRVQSNSRCLPTRAKSIRFFVASLVLVLAACEEGGSDLEAKSYESGSDLIMALEGAVEGACPDPQARELDEDFMEYLGLQEAISCWSTRIDSLQIVESSRSRVFATFASSVARCGLGEYEIINYLYGPNWIVELSQDWDESAMVPLAETLGGTANSLLCSELLLNLEELTGVDPREGPIPGPDTPDDDLRFVLGET